MWICHHRNVVVAEACPEGWNREVHDPRSLDEGPRDGSPLTELPQIQRLSLEITQAPAEFTLPVKQDRQFMPPFRVRVRATSRWLLHAKGACHGMLSASQLHLNGTPSLHGAALTGKHRRADANCATLICRCAQSTPAGAARSPPSRSTHTC
jgi:hypothetical protein